MSKIIKIESTYTTYKLASGLASPSVIITYNDCSTTIDNISAFGPNLDDSLKSFFDLINTHIISINNQHEYYVRYSLNDGKKICYHKSESHQDMKYGHLYSNLKKNIFLSYDEYFNCILDENYMSIDRFGVYYNHEKIYDYLSDKFEDIFYHNLNDLK